MTKKWCCVATDSNQQIAERHIYHLARASKQVQEGLSTWAEHVEVATAAVRDFSRLSNYEALVPHPTRIVVAKTLQSIAYHLPNGTPVQEPADWCAIEWLKLHEDSSDDVDALHGLALSWLHRSQAALHRIYELDVSSSSSSSAPDILILGSERNSLDTTAAAISGSTEEDYESRFNSADYVEARTSLQPSTDYFDLAIAAATRQHRLEGDLLSGAAEALINLGNTSCPRTNERYYQKALRFLRQASDSAYVLSTSLQQFLEEYERYAD